MPTNDDSQTTKRAHPIDILDAVLNPFLGSLPATSAAMSCWLALRRAGYLADASMEETDSGR